MKAIADLLFEAKILKNIPRTGFAFLGAGRESVAEHSFTAAFIAFVMSRMEPEVNGQRLVSMCLLHDLPEARIGDLNYVQKKYVTADEDRAIADVVENLPFDNDIAELLAEFNSQQTREARLAHDADQLAFILDLKSISDVGGKTPEKWLPVVRKRLKTELGKNLAEAVSTRSWDAWWMETYAE
ncbi:putative hydrolase of HD superfamily [Desulfosalsimonas propionicica]|uniref:5'-deoxynucleotidase n=1 Tax=Desulfosalsimonas propionicica TaxID=332175 RepID=A0A7W0HKQ8_9BACT|nr:HD domain-containing protein [Desulfosalsimonas propionicica]MBA2881539.1 putative hydrolase of HD superfamily [Desulfosalsimonas propionicica]